MKVVSVNVGIPREQLIGSRVQITGIYKVPRDHPIDVGPLGMAGDHIANLEHHGGADQAVYVYSSDDYAWWSERLGDVLAPGTFGENITLDSFGPRPVRVGDRFALGTVLLEATAPRIPCATLAARMGDMAFVKRFREARRPGFYARVLTSGKVTRGDTVTVTAAPASHPTVDGLFELFHDANPPLDAVDAALRAPIASRLRAMYDRHLAKFATS